MQTWSWRGKHAASARAGLRAANAGRWHLFFHKIYCIFLMSKCDGESDLGLCTTLVLAKIMLLSIGELRQFFQPNTCFNRNLPMRSGILFASAQVVHRPPSSCCLYFYIETYRKFVWKNQMPTISVWFPQPCSSAVRMFAVSRSHLDYYQFVGRNENVILTHQTVTCGQRSSMSAGSKGQYGM